MTKESPAALDKRPLLASFVGLFASVSTLLCCALPALLVTLGAGAMLAGLISQAPWMTAISHYKVWLFACSAVLIAGAGMLRWHMRGAPCPADPAQAKACMRLRRFSAWVFGASVLLWAVGFFFAFVAVHLL